MGGGGAGAKGKQTMKVPVFKGPCLCVHPSGAALFYCWHSSLQAKKAKKCSLYITCTKTYHQPMTVPELRAV